MFLRNDRFFRKNVLLFDKLALAELVRTRVLFSSRVKLKASQSNIQHLRLGRFEESLLLDGAVSLWPAVRFKITLRCHFIV